MIPRSLSASSALVYEACPARWRAEYQDRAPQPSGDAAILGTVCHEALELWVANGWHERYPDGQSLDDKARHQLDSYYTEAYRRLFTHEDRFEEGRRLCQTWLERQEWDGRTVLSTEDKQSFPLKTSIGEIPFNYIWDRCDRLDDSGEIEVVDYKTISAPIQPDHLKKRIQARAYALAAQIAYPDAPRIWVTFDMLRYEPVGTVFTREENVETWKYLRALAERIIASNGTEEHLNAECRFCVRRHECETLNRHAAAGGHLAITDPAAAAERRLHLDSAKRAIDQMLGELDEVILSHCEHEEVLGFETPAVEVEITARRTRTVDSASVARVVGPDVVAANAKLGVTALDRLLKKDSGLSDEQRSELRQLIRYQHGEPSVRVKPRAAVGEG